MNVPLLRVRQCCKVYIPVSLMLSDVGTYTGDSRLIVSLGLLIWLRMTGSREDSINAKKPTKSVEKLCKELLAAVG